MKNDKTGVCLIGCGRAGMIHARNFNTQVPGARMAAAVDVMEGAAKAAAEELGIDAWYTDYREALINPQVDAVVVVAPTNLHKEIVINAANAKKHVFCEKPMAMDSQECQEMIEACEKNKVKLQIGFMRRHDTSFQQAKKMLDSGAIGDLVMVRSCTRAPSKPQPWMYDLKKSNGILAEVNSHDIDSIRWFAGSEVKELYAIGGNYRNKEVAQQYPDYYDSVIVNGVFENGVQFIFDGAAYVQYGYDAQVELIGTKGILHVGRKEGSFVTCTTVENGTCTPFINSWMTLFLDAYRAEDIAFIDCIQNDKMPPVTGTDGMMAVRIVEAGNRSIEKKSIVHL